MLQRILIACLALSNTTAAFAIELFETNPTTLYPPGCVSTTRSGLTTPTSSRQVYGQDVINLTNAADETKTTSVNVEIFRRGCIEPDRSVMYINFDLITSGTQFATPQLFAQVDGEDYPLRLTVEPNTFTEDETGRVNGLGSYSYIVDGLAELSVNQNSKVLSPSQYNGAFKLIIRDALDSNKEYSVDIPVWTTTIKPFRIPLNGRLTGPWVAEGAADQGFVISFNELPTADSVTQFVFFSWYTFGPDGTPIWLTAGKGFAVGDSEVDLPLELVTNGEFMGGTTADRQVVSTATLRVESCDELTLTYDLTSLGLGSGTATLRRVFSLETAGYACRDLEARRDAM